MNKIQELYENFNKWLALIITNAVGSMTCAYLFGIMTLISLPEAIHGGIATTISWIAQTFLQLVLLAVILVGQNLQSEKSEKRAEEDHDAILAELQEIKDMHAELKEALRIKVSLPR